MYAGRVGVLASRLPRGDPHTAGVLALSLAVLGELVLRSRPPLWPVATCCAALTLAALSSRRRMPLAALAVWLLAYAGETFILGLPGQLTALLVWAILTYASAAYGGSAVAASGGLVTLVPLLIFHVAQPDRSPLDFAPSTLLVVGLAWLGGWTKGRNSPARQPSARRAVPPPSADDARLARLSPREREVLALVASGLSNPAIAERLWISRATVKSHVSNILEKLEVGDRVQAAVLAAETGLAPRLESAERPERPASAHAV